MGLSSKIDEFFFWEIEVLDGESMFFKEEGGVQVVKLSFTKIFSH